MQLPRPCLKDKGSTYDVTNCLVGENNTYDVKGEICALAHVRRETKCSLIVKFLGFGFRLAYQQLTSTISFS
jgi:hypothetical protein